MEKKAVGSETRQTTERITLRFTPDQRAVLNAAIATDPNAWMGVSHFARQAVMHWARGTLAAKRPGRKP